MKRSLVLLLLLLLPAACALSTEPGGGAPGDDLLSVDRAEYAPGDTARVTLRNRLDQPLGYNLCLSAREMRVGSEWRRIEPLRMCLGALFILEEGEEARHEEPITEEWAPGRYRMVTAVERMEAGDRREVRSQEFTVGR